jgi:hypothetical protein
VSRDDLRALLEKFAATAGDPPEHGLDGVAARRRRRTRHRRGAVATAVALAVLAAAVYPRLGWLGDDDHDVTVAETGARTRRTELPDVVELNCTPQGIDVPVASIQPREDGLQLLVHNTRPSATDVWVTSDDWDSGRIRIESNQTRRLSQPVPPGQLTVGCRIGDEDQQRRVDLVDVVGLYEPPELSCGGDEPEVWPEELSIEGTRSMPAAAVAALEGLGVNSEEFEVEAYGGYEEAHYTELTVDPTVEVVQAGDIVAFVHLKGAVTIPGRPAESPWVGVTRLEYCSTLLGDRGPGGDEGTAAPGA